MPHLTIIIAVYNDWIALDSCLQSIAEQGHGEGFEIIVVDDGSSNPAPNKIRQWERGLPVTIVRQEHAGISAARNRGIELSTGSTLLFVDADSRLQNNCLAALESTMAAAPQQDYFQLHLVGDCSTFVGRTEHLRLITLQEQLLQPNGRIRYLNTTAFAIRRSSVTIDRGLFDPFSLRGEDTLLLANLMEREDLPIFVPDAFVEHEVPPSLLRCFRKDIRSAFLEGRTFALIASRGIRIRMSHRQRLSMLRSMWTKSEQPSIGRMAFLILAIRQSLARITSFAYRFLRGGSELLTPDPSSATHL
jgi:cellulose synthase/poly-beta-1,6-N-acetylglucosamine synthase-like glycosyltransferase